MAHWLHSTSPAQSICTCVFVPTLPSDGDDDDDVLGACEWGKIDGILAHEAWGSFVAQCEAECVGESLSPVNTNHQVHQITPASCTCPQWTFFSFFISKAIDSSFLGGIRTDQENEPKQFLGFNGRWLTTWSFHYRLHIKFNISLTSDRSSIFQKMENWFCRDEGFDFYVSNEWTMNARLKSDLNGIHDSSNDKSSSACKLQFETIITFQTFRIPYSCVRNSDAKPGTFVEWDLCFRNLLIALQLKIGVTHPFG